jgi:sigma-B regulation protein RsbU (phosphoserine phosphatase)
MAFHRVASRLLFWVAGTTGILFALALVYSFLVSRTLVLEDASRIAVRTAESHAHEIEGILRSAEEGTRLLASTLEHTTVSPAELEQVIRAFVEGNPRLYGSAAAVAPERQAYAPYFYREGKETKRVDLASGSYRYWEKDWYTAAASSGQPRWSEPYFDEGGGEVLMVTYSVPVFRSEAGERKLLGVVTADLATEWLREVVESEDLEGAAYAVVLSRNGHVLAHPDRRLVVSDKTALELVRPDADPETKVILEMMLRGEEGFVPYRDLYLGKQARAAFRPVGGAGWSFAAIYPEDELLEDVHGLARTELLILAAGLAGLVALVTALASRLTKPLVELSSSAGEIATGNLEGTLPAVRTVDEIGALTSAFHRMRDSLKTYIKDLEATTRAKERLESELQIARRIQVDMLPPAKAGGGPHEGFELHAILEPARHIGGDLYEYFVVDGKLTFVVGDVSGKGVGAALFMARAKTMFHAIARRDPDLADVLAAVNRGLCEENEQGMFVTLFAGVLDLETGDLVYASAGHDPPVVVSGPSSEPRFLEVDGGPVLGLLEASEYRAQRTTLKSGDALVLYTDGVSEALDEKGEFFTTDRLRDLLAKRANTDLAPSVYEAVKAFAGRAPQSDDITVMAVRFTAKRDRGSEGRGPSSPR